VTFWFSADAIDAWRPAPSGRRGAQRKFSDHAIQTGLTLRLVFGLPLRQAEGFLRSVLSLMRVDLDAPDHTTLSRRSQDLAVQFHRVPATGPIHLIVDATGLSIVGEGEWAAVKHGGRGRWKKESRYHRQARVENAFFRYKSIIGDRLRSRHSKAQDAEALFACNILNRMTELGRPASFAIGP
jgi:hypothetical protein|tara:strand:+ start:3312 stop:3860 length:549 start_codon:yes stop_codon:yes gene_type:complete